MMAPSAGSVSSTSRFKGCPPAVISARMPESSSAPKDSISGFPEPITRSKLCPIRTIIALGKRVATKTLSGIEVFPLDQNKGRNRLPDSALVFCRLFARLAEHGSRLNLDAGAHGGGYRNALDVGALGA